MVIETKKRVLSGIQPSGNLTIGNYLGALRQWVSEQDIYECFFCVVDLHAITTPQDPQVLLQKTREVAALYIASGIDPNKSTIFIQSHVSAHSELAWILMCATPLGWLQRMTQFKDKSAKQEQDSVGSGLLMYPSLMAADILLYQANVVPVGDDQRQHLEYTRDIAQRFNHLYGETFTIPEAMIPKAGARIMGLDTPTAKMSKSEAGEYHAVYLLDSPKRARKKIMRAVTDNYASIQFTNDRDRAGVNNLLTIYQSLTGQTNEEIEREFKGKGYGDLKRSVADAIDVLLEPLQARYNEIVQETNYLDRVLEEGALKASEVAASTLEKVKEQVGLTVRRQYFSDTRDDRM